MTKQVAVHEYYIHVCSYHLFKMIQLSGQICASSAIEINLDSSCCPNRASTYYAYFQNNLAL